MDAQTVKLHPSVLLTPTWKGPYLASSLLNTPSPDGYLLPVSLRLLLRLCCLDNLCPLLCLHYDSGSLFSDKLLGVGKLFWNVQLLALLLLLFKLTQEIYAFMGRYLKTGGQKAKKETNLLR